MLSCALFLMEYNFVFLLTVCLTNYGAGCRSSFSYIAESNHDYDKGREG